MIFWSALRAVGVAPEATLEAMLSLESLRLHLRLDSEEEDAQLVALRAAAVGHLESLGIVTVARQWQIAYPGFAVPPQLPLGPVLSVDSVLYTDVAGVEQALAADAWSASLACDPAVILPAGAWPDTAPRPDAVRVLFTAGSAGDAVPAQLVQALRLLIAHWFENREASVVAVQAMRLPFGVTAMIAPYRRGLVA